MKSAIVTGANGFVGSAVVKYLISKNIKVCAVVHNNNTSRLHMDSNLKIISCELSKISDLPSFLSEKYDLFYHFAWMGSAGPQRADYELQLNNVRWTLDAIKIAKQIGCNRFICAGTIMEDETLKATCTDGNMPNPAYIYGAGKAATHMMATPLAVQIGIDLIWTKITNAYGPGELSPRLINTTIQKCILKINPEFTSGIQNYDFVYINDVAEAFYRIGLNGKPFHSYTIGSGSAKSLKEYLLELHNTIAPNLEFKFGDVPFTGINLPLEAFDTKSTSIDTGFNAKTSFVEGCKLTEKWLKEARNNDSKI